MMDVCVLGAGIVGLSTAYALSEQGMRVVVVDAASPGAGASGGNGAQLSYSYVQPLADASIWGQLPKLLFSPDSPLKIRPQWDVQQWRWGLAFMRACNDADSARTTAQLLTLAAQSRQAFECLQAAHRLDCDFSSTGKLVLYPTAQALVAAERQVDLQRRLGSVQSVLNVQQACEVEPALASYQAHFAGAVHTPSECAIDCMKLCQALEQILRARGVQFELGQAVQSLQQVGDQVVAVHTRQQVIEAKHFVLAAGSDSAALARQVGVYLPVYPLKGYSITVDVAQAATHAAPRVNVTDLQRKVVYAPIGQRLRVAGMAELVGHDRSVRPGAIASLQRSVQAVFPGLERCAVDQPWAGLRPATPTGVPVVGVQARGPRNLVMNTGHGALGLTLAFGTAQQVAQQLLSAGAAG